MCVYIYIYVYICIYVYMYIYICVCIYVYIYMFACIPRPSDHPQLGSCGLYLVVRGTSLKGCLEPYGGRRTSFHVPLVDDKAPAWPHKPES